LNCFRGYDERVIPRHSSQRRKSEIRTLLFPGATATLGRVSELLSHAERLVVEQLESSGRLVGAISEPPAFADEAEVELGLGQARRLRIVFVSGEPDTPGHQYRVVNLALALAPKFFETVILRADELPAKLNLVAGAHVVWIWRAGMDRGIAKLISTSRGIGAKIVFDVDDLMFRPEIAKTSIIDGIRSQGFDERLVGEFLCADCTDHATGGPLRRPDRTPSARTPRLWEAGNGDSKRV
jgi:hypothetical protein